MDRAHKQYQFSQWVMLMREQKCLLLKTAIDWEREYGINVEEQKQLGLVVDDEAIFFKEYGGAISMGGLAFSEDGSSIVRVVRTKTGHDAFATHIIPMVDFATGNTPKPEDVKIRALVGSLYNYAKQYGPYEDVERAVYKANKKLGNNDTI